jgi:demethylmenaquinone methyltransferase/2-methoxy-6-polyprenyl-1,4-benzoquinol methylase
MEDDKSITAYYGQRAPEYEQIYFREIPDRRRQIDEEAERVRELTKDKTILELACGTGYWTQIASGNAKSILASDISAEMIAEARKKEYHCPVEFVLADLNHLPFPKHSFDLIILGFWFSHEPKSGYNRLFSTLASLVRVGGRIWMIDNNPPAEGANTDSVGTDEGGNNLKKRQLSNGKEFVIIKNYFSPELLRSIFADEFTIDRLNFGSYYWSVVLTPKTAYTQ